MSLYMCMCVFVHRFTLTFLLHSYVFQFVIVGTFGETPETDIAVDAVCVTACKGKKLSRGNSSHSLHHRKYVYDVSIVS